VELTVESYKSLLSEHGSLAEVARVLGRDPRNLRRWVKKYVEQVPPKYKTTESAVLHLTDLHYGRKTESFDVKVLEERLDRMTTHILEINRILKNGYRFDCLYILLTGDLVDGDEIYATHAYHTDEAARYGLEQATKLAQLLAARFKKLKTVAPKMKIVGVPGNHGRVSRHTHEMNSWDVAALTMLKMLFSEDPDVEVKVGEGFMETVQIQGHGFLLYHGSAIRMFQSVPFYAIRQRILKWAGSLKDGFEVALLGHFHQYFEDGINGKRILSSGTFVTDDEWAIENIGSDGVQLMHFFGVHPEHAITWKYDLEVS
jgi:hypothetical protein